MNIFITDWFHQSALNVIPKQTCSYNVCSSAHDYQMKRDYLG